LKQREITLTSKPYGDTAISLNKKGINIRFINRLIDWFRSSIKIKITVSVLAVFITVYTATIGYVYNRTKTDILKGARQESLSTAQIIANSIYRNYEIPGDAREIQGYIVGTKIYKKNILDLSLYTRDLEVISSTYEDKTGSVSKSPLHRTVIEKNTGYLKIIQKDKKPVIHIIYPVSAGSSGNHLARGCIDLIISLEPKYSDLADIRDNILAAGIIIFIAIFIVITLLSGSLTRPLYKLYSGMKNMDGENPNPQIAVNSSDEIGFLSKTFNEMVLSIKNSEKKIEDYSDVTVNLKSVIKHLEESINRERRFASNVAHELRTPISEIRTLVEVVLSYSNGLRKDDIENYTDILDSARSMEKIVSNLLILSRYDSSALTRQEEVFDLGPLLEETMKRYSALMSGKNLELLNRLERPYLIKSDRGIFGTIIENLLSNAIEYSEKKSGVEISGFADNRSFTLDISNRVFDLNKEDLERLFERFWRKDSARISGSGHSGLGLSLVQSLSDFLGYEIRVELSDNSIIQFILTGPNFL
jgi:signal transduction histidine kinase